MEELEYYLPYMKPIRFVESFYNTFLDEEGKKTYKKKFLTELLNQMQSIKDPRDFIMIRMDISGYNKFCRIQKSFLILEVLEALKKEGWLFDSFGFKEDNNYVDIEMSFPEEIKEKVQNFLEDNQLTEKFWELKLKEFVLIDNK